MSVSVHPARHQPPYYPAKASDARRFVCCTLDVSDIEGTKPAALPIAHDWAPQWDARDYQCRATRFGCSTRVRVPPTERFESMFSVTEPDYGARLTFGLTLPVHSSSMRASIAERTKASGTAPRPSRRAPRVAAKVACWRESSGEISRERLQMRGKEWTRMRNEDLDAVLALS